MANELELFRGFWNREADKTLALLRALPEGSYDFRPDPGGRSIGELAWHLAEGDAYISFGLARGKFESEAKPPGIERPRALAELAPEYERVHREAVARLSGLVEADLDREVPFFDGSAPTIRQYLWDFILFHHLHHRGQLSTLCRQAGGVSPSLLGPNREEIAVLRARLAATAQG